MKELHDLETYEVSLVPKGANGKQFLVFKNFRGQDGMKDAQALVDWITKNVDPAKMKDVEKVIKEFGMAPDQRREGELSGQEGAPIEMGAPLDDKSKAGLQAIARIASPMKGQLHPGHLVKVLQAAGYDMQKGLEIFGNPDGAAHEPDGEPPHGLRDSSQPLQKDHMRAIPEDILSDMKDVLKEKMSKGEEVMPKEEAEKAHHHEDFDDDDDEGQGDSDELEKAIKSHMQGAYDEAKKAYKSHMEKMGYRKYPDVQPRMKGVQKDIKQVDVDSIVHDDTEEKGMGVTKALDLSKVDPKLKPALEAIFKGQKELVEKAERIEKENASLKEAARTKELVEKASKLGIGANTDDLVAIMKALPADQLAKFEGIMSAAGEQVKKSGLFSEIGTVAAGTLSDAESKLWALADSVVQKSGDGKLTREAAYEQVLKTAEGKRLYGEYMAQKPGMKV